MDWKILKDTPPWDWPEDADEMFLGALRNNQANASDRLFAAELAGDLAVINDEIVEALLSTVRSGVESERMRSLGVCAAEESRYSMSTLSAAHIQYVVVTVAQNRSAAQTPSRDFFGTCPGAGGYRHVRGSR